MIILFHIMLFLVFFTYFGYPLSLIIIGLFKKKVVQRKEIYLSVTLIITAYNEEKRIEEKLKNTLEIDYPKDKLQVIVASDGSTDCTNDIVSGYKDYGIQLLAIRKRQGKENAQKEAVKLAKGKILVFTDAATILDPGGIKSIISNFADAGVGCVSSTDNIIGKDGRPSGEGLYVKYEMFLRNIESNVNSLVGLSGSYFAARKEVCQDFSSNMQSDFRTLLNCIKMGLRGINDPNSIGNYMDIADEKREFQRKVRTVVRGLTVFFNHLDFLNCFKYGIFSYQYFSHKLLRWLVPFFLGLAFILNIFLAFETIYFLILMVFQLIFYLSGILQIRGLLKIRNKIFKIPQYFLTVNYSILIAWFKYLNGHRIVLWQPSKR